MIASPGAAARRRTPACSPATATACCSSTAAARARARATATCFGWGGDKDILAAVEFLQDPPGRRPRRIGGLGLSVGGELMLQAAAETDELAAVVSEGAGTRSFSRGDGGVRRAATWFSAPLLAAMTPRSALFSNTAPPPNLTDLAPRIHAAALRDLGPERRQHRDDEQGVLPLASSGSKTIWAIPTAKHVGGIRRAAHGVRAARRRLLRPGAPGRHALAESERIRHKAVTDAFRSSPYTRSHERAQARADAHVRIRRLPPRPGAGRPRRRGRPRHARADADRLGQVAHLSARRDAAARPRRSCSRR